MNGFRFGLLMALAGVCMICTSAGAVDYSGLWMGTATIKAVSEVNQRASDMSFDLGLEGVKAGENLISEDDTWKYNDTGMDLGTAWLEPDYDDSAWLSGQAAFGYGTQVATTVSYGSDPSEKHTTTYFRTHFTVNDPSRYVSFTLKIWRDDGIVIYMNGEEIFRNNMSTSYIDYHATALSNIQENVYLEISLPVTLFEEGENLVAVEIHPVTEDDADLLFKMRLDATLKESGTTQLIGIESADWKYHASLWGPGAQSETDPMDSDWHDPGYDDSGWPAGQAQFGYGEDDENTTLTFGEDPRPPTIYFRKTFSLPDTDFSYLRLMLLQDDGAVVYLNGKEILRTNLPAGPVGHDTEPVLAIGSSDENRYMVSNVHINDEDGVTLNQNGNVIAVAIHQHPSELGGTQAVKKALTRAIATFDLRLLIHVDASGKIRLLKEAIHMYDSKNNRFVLLTDHALIPNYSGVVVRDGQSVGRRLSTVGFDFETQTVDCQGSVSPQGTLTSSFTLPSSLPTNPFLHRYHPDHDNLDARYENVAEEVYEIQRDIKIVFSDRYPPDTDEPVWPTPPPGWGESLLGGNYTETLKGLHKEDITVSGPIILRRATDIATLNE